MEKEAVLLRKIIVFVLVLTTIVVLFTACSGDKGDDGTTVDPLYTAYIPSGSTTTQNSQSTSSSPAANAATGATYILTTNQSKTAPWYSTTRFVPTPVTSTTQSAATGTTTNSYNNITYTTNSAMLSPSVTAYTTKAPSTTWKQVSTTTAANTSKVTAATTQKPTTTKPQPVGVDVIVNDIYISDGKLCASIDTEGWGSKIKSTSKRIPIYIDGIEASSPALMQISSSTTGDGFQYVYIDLSDFEVLDYGGTVSFTVPEGVLNNSTGTRYNYSFDVEASL